MEYFVFSTDLTQAYLQGTGNLMRDVFSKAPLKLEIRGNKLLQLENLHYGLADS